MRNEASREVKVTRNLSSLLALRLIGRGTILLWVNYVNGDISGDMFLFEYVRAEWWWVAS